MFEYLDLPSGPIHWKDYGGSGDTIVMVHGLGGSIANWDLIGPRLTGDWRVVALDLPGFGLTPPGRNWSLDTHAKAIVELVEHLETPVILMGNSMGGLLSEKVAAERPDLVSGLVLLAPATPPRVPDPHIHWPTARRLIVNATPLLGPALSRRLLSTMTPRELINDSIARITHKPGRVPLDLIESFVRLAEIRANFPWTADAIPKTGQSIRALFLRRGEFVSMVRQITTPTLVVQGVEDRIISRTAVEWLCFIRPDWELIQLEDTGHTPQIDAPIRTLSVIRPWLEGAEVGGRARPLALPHVF